VIEGDGARELRELDGCLGGSIHLDDPAELVPDPFRRSPLLSRATGPENSLSVGAVLIESSMSPALLLPPPLVDAEPETRLKVDELALMSLSFSFAFSSKSMKMRDLASLYAASRCSRVRDFFKRLGAPPRPPRLPASEGSTSEDSASSPLTEPVRDCDCARIRSWTDRLIILMAGCFVCSTGTSSEIRFGGLRGDGYRF
jgi:hypothetical protein